MTERFALEGPDSDGDYTLEVGEHIVAYCHPAIGGRFEAIKAAVDAQATPPTGLKKQILQAISDLVTDSTSLDFDDGADAAYEIVYSMLPDDPEPELVPVWVTKGLVGRKLFGSNRTIDDATLYHDGTLSVFCADTGQWVEDVPYDTETGMVTLEAQ